MKTKPTKAIVGAVGAFVTVLVAVFADDVVSVDELGQIAAALVPLAVTVYGVWRVTNKPVE